MRKELVASLPKRKPARCPGCKSPYWDKPPPPETPNHERTREPRGTDEGCMPENGRRNPWGRSTGKVPTTASLAQALDVFKEMKAAGRTWQEMGERAWNGNSARAWRRIN